MTIAGMDADTFRLASSILFVLVHKSNDPFRCHLFGVLGRPQLLPAVSPYWTLGRSYVSDLSFECRFSRSISARPLVPLSSTTDLVPQHPEKAVGLGIYTRQLNQLDCPSLSSVRSHPSGHSTPQPPVSPLPPLPACFPTKYRYRDTAPSTMRRAIYPPKTRPVRPARPQSEYNIRVTPPSPVLSTANLLAFNKSVESLSGSSIYSRSVSGERRVTRPASLGAISRTVSSESTVTVKRSPLGIMRGAEDHQTIVAAKDDTPRVSTDGLQSDVDDAGALQAKLPVDKAGSWHVRDHGIASFYERSKPGGVGGGGLRKLEWTPLPVAKTRATVAFPTAGRCIKSVA